MSTPPVARHVRTNMYFECVRVVSCVHIACRRYGYVSASLRTVDIYALLYIDFHKQKSSSSAAQTPLSPQPPSLPLCELHNNDTLSSLTQAYNFTLQFDVYVCIDFVRAHHFVDQFCLGKTTVFLNW